MKTNEMFKLFDKAFLEKVYSFAYHRCNTSHEAEDLCSQIVVAVIAAMKSQETVENFYGFLWTIARRVYADYCEKRSKEQGNVSLENTEYSIASKQNEIDVFIENTAAAQSFKKILYEISFLSKSYRDVMVMYYIDEIKIKDIAVRLGISETTVKQRLFSARNEVRKEVSRVKDKNLALKPIHLFMPGTGKVGGNDCRTLANRLFSQNLIYLCKDKPKTAKELSEELGVPMPYVEEELEIQLHGLNGEYGMLRKLPDGKYITNVIIMDYKEFKEVNGIFDKHLPEISKQLKINIEKYKDEILRIPYLSRQDDIRFILWTLIAKIIWGFKGDISEKIKKKYFANVDTPNRPFSTAALAYRDEENPNFNFYGCDTTNATEICGYKKVFISNLYDTKRKEKIFEAGYNLSRDHGFILFIKTIKGASVNTLNDVEKEIAAKWIEYGFIRKKGDALEPNIVAISIEDEEEFTSFAYKMQSNFDEIKEKIADELAEYMIKHIPAHLMCEYRHYIGLLAGINLFDSVVDECIKNDILIEPTNKRGPEGVLLVVEK